MDRTEAELLMPIKANPFQHQVEAFAFTMDLFGVFSDKEPESTGVAYLMEMGAGKSLTAISSMGCLYQMGKINKALIVAPLSILPVWEEELQKFAAFPFSAVVLSGSMDKKREQISGLSGTGVQIVIVNYESMWRLRDELLAYHADLIIADEAHKLKESRTAQSKAMHVLGDAAQYRMILTGTPVTNHEVDIWSEYRFLNPEIFGASFYAFRSRFFTMGGYGLHTPIFKLTRMDEFLEKLHSVAFRCRKEDCLDLPPITEEVRTVDLEPAARKIYDRIQEESYVQLKGDAEVTAANVLTRLLRLLQVTGGCVTDDTGTSRQVSTAKLDALSDLVDTANEEEQKLVVMAHFRFELDGIEAMLQKKKINYAVIRGGVKDRGEQVKRFQNDPTCTVFLGQIQAAGEGITLTASSTMVFFSLDYSMAHFEQAKARIHRSGQTRHCNYIYLCCRNSVDQRVIQALQEKKDLAQMLIDDYYRGVNPYAGGR